MAEKNEPERQPHVADDAKTILTTLKDGAALTAVIGAVFYGFGYLVWSQRIASFRVGRISVPRELIVNAGFNFTFIWLTVSTMVILPRLRRLAIALVFAGILLSLQRRTVAYLEMLALLWLSAWFIYWFVKPSEIKKLLNIRFMRRFFVFFNRPLGHLGRLKQRETAFFTKESFSNTGGLSVVRMILLIGAISSLIGAAGSLGQTHRILIDLDRWADPKIVLRLKEPDQAVTATYVIEDESWMIVSQPDEAGSPMYYRVSKDRITSIGRADDLQKFKVEIVLADKPKRPQDLKTKTRP